MSEINENKEVTTTDMVSVEEVTEKPVKEDVDTLTASEYKVIVENVKAFKEQYEELKQTVTAFVTESLDLQETALVHVLKFDKEGIRNTNISDLRMFLEEHQNHPDERFENLEDEEIYDLIERINKSSEMLYSMEKQYNEIMSESGEILSEYMEYMNSNRMNKTMENRIQAMKAAAELETSEYKKGKINKMVAAMEACTTHSYLFSQFNDEYRDRNVKSIKDAYFDKQRSRYVIDKFMDKIKRFGYDGKIYRYFFNLEETFMKEKYHVFNNFSLFMFMRTVAYADPGKREDQLIVKSYIGDLTNLIYHRFESTEAEAAYVSSMEKVLDLFEESAEYFNVNNMTHPNHPVRLENEKAAEAHRKFDCINTMKSMGITGYDEEWSSTELMKFMNEKIEHMNEERAAKSEEVEAAEEESIEEDTDETVENDEELEEDFDAELDEYIKEENEKVDKAWADGTYEAKNSEEEVKE